MHVITSKGQHRLWAVLLAMVLLAMSMVASIKPASAAGLAKCATAQHMVKTSKTVSGRIRVIQPFSIIDSFCSRPHPTKKGYREVFAVKAEPSTGAIETIIMRIQTDPYQSAYDQSAQGKNKWILLRHPIPMKAGQCAVLRIAQVAYTNNFNSGTIVAYFPCVK